MLLPVKFYAPVLASSPLPNPLTALAFNHNHHQLAWNSNPREMISLAAARIAASLRVLPTQKGITSTVVSLGVVGTTAFALKSSGVADAFLLRYPWDDDEKDETERNALSRVGGFVRILGRTLLVPGLVEEVLWRGATHPHPLIDKFPPSLPSIVLINTVFALYHLIGAQFAVSLIGKRPGGAVVFRDLAFLGLAFVLGNACSFAYICSGGGLWAPVLLHGLVVAAWLDWCGGETALKGVDVDETDARQAEQEILKGKAAKSD